MTFKTTVQDKQGNPVPLAAVFANDEVTGNSFVRGTDGNGYADVDMKSTPSNIQVTMVVTAPGYQNSISYLLTSDKDQSITINLDSFNLPSWRPSREEVRKFKGAFCIPDVFSPEDNMPYGDGKRIWTPAFLCYDDAWQDKIIEKYKSFNYTHFVLEVGGAPYHGDYPDLPDDPAAARKAIIKLLNAHLIPVVVATDDRQPDVVLESYKACADIIDSGFVMWEMNGPCQDDSDRMFAITSLVMLATPYAYVGIHFTAGHGSMGEPEGYWWHKCASIGISCLYSQDDGFNRNRDTGDPEGAAAGLEDTARHLHGQVAGWGGLNLDNQAFEQTTTPVYHKFPGWDGTKQRAYGDYLNSHCPNIAGFCDGANVH